ncbi:putative phosphoesterase [Methanohalophilus levihalophilus]|uniref:metallophosphoesterase n=1 Tax=Methanohalophilus levihalophilus TaxID=1431282 RepID=UPI001AE10D0E|nr:metallophosphoesterase [Methanohalophilus levihalophilus]MBP2029770.1 putative phosphoesterase [Methanohalophilus levihalophilus]
MIGIISDTHDHLNAAEEAIEILNKNELTAVLHAGDLVSPFMARAFSKLEPELYMVSGNNDGDKMTIKTLFEEFGTNICGDFASIEIENRKIALLHGTDELIIDSLAKSGNFDLVVRGHTHETSIKKIGKSLIINPGECCGVLSGKRTLAFWDPETNEAEIVEF